MQLRKNKKTNKSVEQKALEILSYSMRSERELREKLAEYGFSDDDIDKGVRYVRSYGYINDALYAEQYVASKGARKGRNALRIELRQKGVSEEFIEAALETLDESEEDTAYALLIQKAGEPHAAEEKEYARLYRFLAARGFSQGAAYSALKKYTGGDG